MREALRSIRLSGERSLAKPTGSLWFSEMYCSIRRRARNAAGFARGYGAGASPETV